MEVYWKRGIKIMGCSKWKGGNTRKICHLCLSEYKSSLLKNTPIKTHYNPVKTVSNTVKTVSILGEGR